MNPFDVLTFSALAAVVIFFLVGIYETRPRPRPLHGRAEPPPAIRIVERPFDWQLDDR